MSEHQKSTTKRLLRALKNLELQDQVHKTNRRSQLLELVSSHYEDLYQNTPTVPHPVFGDRG
jgi:hypothetical protein